MTDSFGARLRAERLRRGIGLEAIANATKVNVALFEALERNDASRWPSGIFRRAFIRGYAKEIGLDPEETLREFLENFPDGSAPAGEVGNADARSAASEQSAAEARSLRLTLADEPVFALKAPADLLFGWTRRLPAAFCDVATVLLVAGVWFAAGGRFWTPFAVTTAIYYFGGVLALGTTPGAWIASRIRTTRQADQSAPIPLHASAETDEAADNVRQFRRRRYPKAV